MTLCDDGQTIEPAYLISYPRVFGSGMLKIWAKVSVYFYHTDWSVFLKFNFFIYYYFCMNRMSSTRMPRETIPKAIL